MRLPSSPCSIAGVPLSQVRYYCTPPVIAPAVIGVRAVWRQNNQVSPCAPATMLGLRFKQDTCIVSPKSVASYANYSRIGFDLLLREIVTQ